MFNRDCLKLLSCSLRRRDTVVGRCNSADHSLQLPHVMHIMAARPKRLVHNYILEMFGQS